MLAGGVGKGGGEVCFPDSDTSQKDDVGAFFEEAEAEGVHDFLLINGAWPVPQVLVERFDYGQVCFLYPAFEGVLFADADFTLDESFEELEVSP